MNARTSPTLTCQFSHRVRNLQPSPIREILSVIDRPGMISFAGGLPATETFPELDFSSLPNHWLQYGSTEGEPVLRNRIAAELEAIGLNCSPEQIVILSGSQQGIDLVGKLFIDDGTSVAVESPTYLAALQVFRFFGAQFVTVSPDKPGGLESDTVRPAFVYAIPTFQNPSGRCYSEAQRETMAGACDMRSIPLFEDDPYRDLAYDPCDRRPICGRLKRASWIYQGSYSKIFAPGLRLGFLAASKDLVPHLVRLKQAADLHSNRISQWLVLQLLNHPGREQRMKEVVQTYRTKRDAFAGELDRRLGKFATWQVPPGGLFFWLTLKEPRDTRALLPVAIDRGLAFMPGEPFFAVEDHSYSSIRLNFSHATQAQAAIGLKILEDLLERTER